MPAKQTSLYFWQNRKSGLCSCDADFFFRVKCQYTHGMFYLQWTDERFLEQVDGHFIRFAFICKCYKWKLCSVNGDLDPFIEIIRFVCEYLIHQEIGFLQICIDVSFRQAEKLIRFRCPRSHFQGGQQYKFMTDWLDYLQTAPVCLWMDFYKLVQIYLWDKHKNWLFFYDLDSILAVSSFSTRNTCLEIANGIQSALYRNIIMAQRMW